MKQRSLLIVVMIIFLAGCYQQASDSFETVNSSGGDVIVGTPTATPQLIDPNVLNEGTPTVIVIQSDVIVPTEGEPPVIIVPSSTPQTAQSVPATPTLFIIQPTLSSPTPQTLLIPTATTAGIITPQVQSQLVIPTSTPLVVGTVDSNNPNAIPTPTDLPIPTSGACLYVVKSGENLFRIAINNDVALADLLAINSLTGNSIIQPGQEIRLPDCDASTGVTGITTLSTATPSIGNPISTGGAVHRVVNGDTLSTIAQSYGVTIQQIVDANNLTNPNSLSIGQELIIPN